MLRPSSASLRPILRSLFAAVFTVSSAHAFASGTLSFVPSGGQGSAVNMGTVNIGATGAAVATQTLTFMANGGPVTFGSSGLSGGSGSSAVSVLTLGAPNQDFTLSTSTPTTCSGTLNSGKTCTVTVNFSPLYAGARNGAVQVLGSSGVLATVLVYGAGNGPQVAFNPASTAVTTLSSGFSNISGVAADGAGNVYLADTGNNAVREMVAVGGSVPTSNPTIMTLGSGFSTPAGVAVDGAGNIYVADTGNNAVKEMVAVGGSVPASNPTILTLGSGFNNPNGVVVDSVGNVYVADTGNSAVKEMVAVGGSIPASNPTIVALGSGFSSPTGVAVDGAGNVYVADAGNNAVKEMVAVGGSVPANNPTIVTLGSGFSSPTGVAVDGAGDVYVADAGNNAVKEMVAVGGSVPASNPTILTLGGGFGNLFGLALDSAGNVYVADRFNHALKEIPRFTPPSNTFSTSTNGGSTDTADGPFTVTLANIGNQTLTFPAPTATNGQNPSLSLNFSLTGTGSTGACPVLTPSATTSGTLAEGASCTAQVNFTPTGPSSGTVSGQLIFSDTNLNAPTTAPAMQKVNFSGTANRTVFQIAFGSKPSPSVGAGQNAGVVTVVEEDGSGNPVTGGNDTITLTVTYPDSTTKTYMQAASGGTASFDLTGVALTQAGSYTYTASLASNTPVNAVNATESLVAATNTALTSSQNPVLVVTQVTYTATVTALVPGTGTPTGSVTFSTPGQASQTVNLNGSGVAQANYTFLAGSNAQVTATFNGSTYFQGSNSSLMQTVQQAYSYLVTTLGDDPTGVAGNCVSGATDASGGNSNCSLRDAIAAANAVGLANITSGTTISFLSSLASAANPQTINLAAQGQLNISQSMTINGLGANALTLSVGGSGEIMRITAGTVTANALTFVGGSNSAVYVNSATLTVTNSIFNANNSGGMGAAIFADSGAGVLTVTNSTFTSNQSSTGGAIGVRGAGAIITNSTFVGNTASVEGGAVYLDGGTSYIRNSTFSGNSITTTIGGGAVYNDTGSVATVTNSIIATNTAPFIGGGISNAGTLTSQNNVFYQNTVMGGGESDCAGCTTNTNAVSGNPNLSTLGNYGGTVTTMVPLASSAAICAGTVALSSTPLASNNQSYTDARGATHSSAYCSASQLDAGAAQTSYAISFTQNPPSIVPASTAISPSPSATVIENSLGISGASVTMSAATGTLSGTTTVSSVTGGVATFSNLQIVGVQPNDTLTASLALNTGVSGSPLTASSSSFGSLVITPATLTAGQVGVAYSQQLSTANGTAPYTYSLVSGSQLPAGLSLTASGTNAGTISGTPAAGGSFSFTVEATDSNGGYATQLVALVLAPATIVVAPATLPTFTVGTVVSSLGFVASGGTYSYTYKVTTGSLPAGLILNTATGIVTGTPTTAGPYSFQITATDSSTGSGPYSGASGVYSGTVQKGTATVTLSGLSQLYNNGQPLPVTATTAPPPNLTVIILYGPVGTTPTSSTVPSQQGQYAVSATVQDNNWVGSATGTEIIAKSAATVTFGNLNFTYTGSPISTTATTSNPSGLAVNITYNGSSIAPTAAGSYTVVATVSDPNYSGSATNTMVVGKANLTITGPTVSSVYGAPLPSLNGTYSGALGNDSFTVTGTVTPSGVTLGVGNYPITPSASGTALVNYNVTPMNGQLTITPATLTIKGPSVSVVYGASQLPSLNGTYSGAVNGDTFTVSGTTTATTLSNVVAGGYAITPSVSSGSSGNYTVVAVPGVLTITPATLTITGPTLDKVYGAAVPSPLKGTYSGNVGTDSFVVSGTTTAAALSPVVAGGYPIMPSVSAANGTNLSNYNVKPVNGTLNVTPATLTITGPAIASVYGGAVPSLAGTYSGNVGTDTFTVSGSITGNPSQLTAGNYTITPTVTGTNLSSYTVVPVLGSLTVTKATLTITGPTLSKVYGTANPSLAGTYSGNVNGDVFTVSGSTTATTNSPVSAAGYAITPAAAGTNLASYNVTPVNGSLIVTPAAITVTVAAATKTYGSANPTLTGAVTGVLSGDGITPVYSTTATAGSIVGTYPITATLSDPNSKLSDYTVVNAPNVLTITKATPTVTLSAPSAPVFSQTSITLTASVTAVGGSPTGIVSFVYLSSQNSATVLGSVLLNSNGVASIAVPTLPSGSGTVSAVYSGDTNYVSVTSSTSTVLVQDFGFSTTTIPGQTASLGGTAAYNFTLTPLNGTTFPSAITLSLNGLPIGATYTFTPSSIAAGSGSTAVKLTVTLPQQLANNEAAPANLGRRLAPWSLALLMLPLFARTRGRRSFRRLLCIAFLVAAGSAATVAMTGCGSSNANATTQQTSFNLTITAASGNLSHSIITTLNVQ